MQDRKTPGTTQQKAKAKLRKRADGMKGHSHACQMSRKQRRHNGRPRQSPSPRHDAHAEGRRSASPTRRGRPLLGASRIPSPCIKYGGRRRSAPSDEGVLLVGSRRSSQGEAQTQIRSPHAGLRKTCPTAMPAELTSFFVSPHRPWRP